MKKKTNENIDQATETAGKAVATPGMLVSNEEAKNGSEEAFDVRPSEAVTIIAGNRVLFVGNGLKEIRVAR